MPDATEAADRELRRQLATLTYSQVLPALPADAITAAAWWNLVARLGFPLPLVVVHDFGLVLTAQRRGGLRQVRRDLGRVPAPVGRYQALLARVAASEAVTELGAAPLRDDVLAVILARVLGDVYLRWAPRGVIPAELPASSPIYDLDRDTLARAHDPGWSLAFVQRLVDHERGVLARLDQIEAGALRLLGLFSAEGGAADLGDLYQLLGSGTGATDVVDFSLQLLPSLLETKRRPSAQRFSIDGYVSVERRGNVDALLPGELAHDEDVFVQKALSDDLLFYGHERRNEATRRLHVLLIDASASMRGAREIFARGLALALAKKLSLMGGDVWLRFFDSRLHARFDLGRTARRDLPRFLAFRSERGRNYARVFSDLVVELGRLVRDEGRQVAVTFITHGACHIPLSTVETLAGLAHLTGVFVLPSQPLDLEYLPRLHRTQVVTAASLARPADKRRRALEIIDEAAGP
ncbi:MAG TPA: hypothetical protein VN962_17115 [Polyangia bacterium]|nr:hypothetical protein [Polyangia bacterium]